MPPDKPWPWCRSVPLPLQPRSSEAPEWAGPHHAWYRLHSWGCRLRFVSQLAAKHVHQFADAIHWCGIPLVHLSQHVCHLSGPCHCRGKVGELHSRKLALEHAQQSAA